MSGYIKNKKDPGGSKWLSAEDEEDFEQEKLIQQWLQRQGRAQEFTYEHINRKGAARNTRVRAHVHLDAKIQEDESGTYADFIAGSDGRNLECAGGAGQTPDEFDPKSEFEKRSSWFLTDLNIPEGTAKWVTETLLKNAKMLTSSKETNSRHEKPRSISSMNNLGSPRRLRTFKRL